MTTKILKGPRVTKKIITCGEHINLDFKLKSTESTESKHIKS